MHAAPVQRTILSTRRIMVPPLTLCAYMKKGPNLRWSLIQCSGGDEGDRTPDLLTASQALSQLSYAPVRKSTIRELPRRCKDNFGKTFAPRGVGTQPAADAGAGTGPEAPRCPFPLAGTRPAGGSVAAALLPGAPRTSRIPPSAVYRLRSAVRHPPNGRPAISKPCRFTGPGREAPSMPQSAKSRPQVGDLRIP